MHTVSYNEPGQAGQVLAQTVTTTEANLLTITNYQYHKKSQITVYYDVTLGSATSVKFRYYYSWDNGTTWFQVPVKNTSTGILIDVPTVLDATSPVQTANIRTLEDFGYSGANAFKITGQSVAANATVNSLTVFVRDN